jgi:hypothetical protein
MEVKTGYLTLGETVYKAVEEKKTGEDWFKALVKFHTREKLWELYLAEKLKRDVPDPKSET